MLKKDTLRFGFKRIKLIDALSEDFEFGHRIALGQILNSKQGDFEIMQTLFSTLYGVNLKSRHIKKALPHLKEITEGLSKWVQKEKALHYEPTPEEQRAGADNIAKTVKEFGVIDAIAIRMTISHDQALQLSYNTVYLMLLKDKLTSQVERNLHKIATSK